MTKDDFYLISAIPNVRTRVPNLIQSLGKKAFSIVYDLANKRTLLWVPEEPSSEAIMNLSKAVPGLEFTTSGFNALNTASRLSLLAFYRSIAPEGEPLLDVMDLNAENGFIALVFIPPSNSELARAKNYLETMLSSKNIKETHLATGWFRSKLGNISMHKDVYQDSAEQTIMKQMLESINTALLTNNLLYKVFILFDQNKTEIKRYVENRFIILSDTIIPASPITKLVEKASKINALPFGFDYCSALIRFYGSYKVNKIIQIPPLVPVAEGILVGKRMEQSVYQTNEEIKIPLSSLNLGTIITGLPGSGKTIEAMHIVEEAIKKGDTPTFILAPTSEWNSHAITNGMKLVRLFYDTTRINLFRCPPNYPKERFYQDLSSVMSSASDAGPFRRPMEKCLLNAFRRAYADTTEPDPVAVYEAIDEAIIRLHGKLTNTGVKYTKHGENIRAALESLRIILNDYRYSEKDGLHIEGLMKSGAVFDMSNTSSITRPFLYALFLNQLYAISSLFDTNGDGQLRMLICIEESQIIFKEEDSTAVIDIKQRIQDFRKRGIGLMLLCHNITDIDSGIRRLCQIKLYFKQAPDLAYLAAKELVFSGIEPETIIDKMKTLDSRIAAFSSVSREDHKMIQQETIILRTADYTHETISDQRERCVHTDVRVPEKVAITLQYEEEMASKEKVTLKLLHLGDLIVEVEVNNSKLTVEIIKNRTYKLVAVNSKGRILSSLNVFVEGDITLLLTSDRRLLQLTDL